MHKLAHFFFEEKFGEEWFTYPNVYRLMVDKCEQSGTIVELGAWKGRSSAFLVVEAKNKSPNIKIEIVDTWLGSEEHTDEMKDNLYEKFKSNMARLDKLYKEHRMTTNEAAHLFEDESLDGVFIDANHTYKAVKKDIADWMPKVRKGGVLAGHDYIQTFEGVVRAVNESITDFVIMEQCWVKLC
jgi:predicted O-methyltransferase YrrM